MQGACTSMQARAARQPPPSVLPTCTPSPAALTTVATALRQLDGPTASAGVPRPGDRSVRWHVRSTRSPASTQMPPGLDAPAARPSVAVQLMWVGRSAAAGGSSSRCRPHMRTGMAVLLIRRPRCCMVTCGGGACRGRLKRGGRHTRLKTQRPKCSRTPPAGLQGRQSCQTRGHGRRQGPLCAYQAPPALPPPQGLPPRRALCPPLASRRHTRTLLLPQPMMVTPAGTRYAGRSSRRCTPSSATTMSPARAWASAAARSPCSTTSAGVPSGSGHVGSSPHSAAGPSPGAQGAGHGAGRKSQLMCCGMHAPGGTTKCARRLPRSPAPTRRRSAGVGGLRGAADAAACAAAGMPAAALAVAMPAGRSRAPLGPWLLRSCHGFCRRRGSLSFRCVRPPLPPLHASRAGRGSVRP